MLAKPPEWLAFPPLEAISLTSSLGLSLLVSLSSSRECKENIPVGKVAGILVVGASHVDDMCKCLVWVKNFPWRNYFLDLFTFI
jgi:hypothetical protein